MNTVYFFAEHLYYLPQYAPVYWQLRAEGVDCRSFALNNEKNSPLIHASNESLGFTTTLISQSAWLDLVRHERPDWCVFGNAELALDQLHPHTQTALLYHGIGIKASYYSDALQGFDVRFTEGEFRQQQLQRLFPQERLVNVGFAKLDPLFGSSTMPFEVPSLQRLGLDANRPTVLYAPTFYPSSIECLPPDWPHQMQDFNLIIKPHLMSFTHKAYAAQRRRFEAWAQFPHVHMAPAHAVSLLPYMAVADVLLSEASSALFEFAAMDKPVLWLDFMKLRWSYRGIFSYRFKERMDQTIVPYFNIGAHAAQPGEVVGLVQAALNDRSAFAAERAKATQELIGPTDGQCAARIVRYLREHAHDRR